MGQTLWVDIEGRAKDDLPADNSIILRLDGQLQLLAKKLNVPKLNEFFDHSVLAKEFGESLPESWFDPSAPLTTIARLREHLDAQPEDLEFVPSRSQQHWPTALMAELTRCEASLSGAMEQGKKVRFLIIP